MAKERTRNLGQVTVSNNELLNLAHLRAFKLVADTGSATRAAAELFQHRPKDTSGYDRRHQFRHPRRPERGGVRLVEARKLTRRDPSQICLVARCVV